MTLTADGNGAVFDVPTNLAKVNIAAACFSWCAMSLVAVWEVWLEEGLSRWPAVQCSAVHTAAGAPCEASPALLHAHWPVGPVGPVGPGARPPHPPAHLTRPPPAHQPSVRRSSWPSAASTRAAVTWATCWRPRRCLSSRSARCPSTAMAVATAAAQAMALAVAAMAPAAAGAAAAMAAAAATAAAAAAADLAAGLAGGVAAPAAAGEAVAGGGEPLAHSCAPCT